MAQARSATGVHSGRAAARSRRVALLSAVVALLAATLAGPAAAAPAPTNVRITPGVGSLRVYWEITSTGGLSGFHVRWRAVSGGVWTKPVERPASARGFKITGLAREPYEVRVRAIVAEDVLGGAREVVGTPLAGRDRSEREAEEEAEREAKERAEREKRERAEREAERVEREAKEKAEREAKEKAEREAKEKAEREAKERTEREAKEKAEREAKERAEREAKERAEREAKERAEREAREKAEREQREREERERKGHEEPGGPVVGKAPSGPRAPASGWHIVYADGFGAPLGSAPGQDDTLQSGEKWNGCCTNSNEIAVEQHSQARVGPGGLELACSEGAFTVEGVTRKYSCGGVRGDAFVEWNYATSGEWVAECVCRWPANTGADDPGWWVYTGAQEIDFFEGWGWNGTSWLNSNAGMPVIVGQHEFELGLVAGVLGFDPSAALHRYTTAFVPLGGQSFHVVEYIDGIERWSYNANLANTSDGPILTNGLRAPTGGGHAAADVMTVRSIAVYQDGAHAGQGVRGGGIAPGTTLAP